MGRYVKKAPRDFIDKRDFIGPTRERSEEILHFLATRFPKCFFVDPSQRRPLKRDIIDDLDEQNVLDHARLEQAIDWYVSAYQYRYGLQKAGAERVDLDGNQAGTVTPQEAQEASAWITAQKRAFGRPLGKLAIG